MFGVSRAIFDACLCGAVSRDTLESLSDGSPSSCLASAPRTFARQKQYDTLESLNPGSSSACLASVAARLRGAFSRNTFESPSHGKSFMFSVRCDFCCLSCAVQFRATRLKASGPEVPHVQRQSRATHKSAEIYSGDIYFCSCSLVWSEWDICSSVTRCQCKILSQTLFSCRSCHGERCGQVFVSGCEWVAG